MDTPPVGISDQDVTQCLGDGWGLAVDRVEYVPKGFGSHHWLAVTSGGERYFLSVDDLDHKPWLGTDRDATFKGLQAAFATALALREEVRLPFVVAPIPSPGGDTAHRLAPRYSLAAFPFIQGQAGHWGDELGAEDRNRLLRILGKLHLASTTVAPPPRRGVDLPGRAGLEAALAELAQPWRGGPLSEPARGALAASVDTVRGWLATFDDLAGRVASPPVITHGEPHPGNLIRAEGGLLLIDWDTVALTPPERDLWMLDDGSADGLAAYSETTGRAVDPTAISLYRLTWTLADVANFVDTLRWPHERNPDTELAWRCLRDYLSP